MTCRPGTVKADVRVEIERTRDSTRAEFNDLKKYLTSSRKSLMRTISRSRVS